MKTRLSSKDEPVLTLSFNPRKWCQATESEILQDFQALGHSRDSIKSLPKKNANQKIIRKQVDYTQRKLGFRKPCIDLSALDACLGFATLLSELQNIQERVAIPCPQNSHPSSKPSALPYSDMSPYLQETMRNTCVVQRPSPLKRGCMHIAIAYYIYNLNNRGIDPTSWARSYKKSYEVEYNRLENVI